jgi:hypothetical protein
MVHFAGVVLATRPYFDNTVASNLADPASFPDHRAFYRTGVQAGVCDPAFSIPRSEIVVKQPVAFNLWLQLIYLRAEYFYIHEIRSIIP